MLLHSIYIIFICTTTSQVVQYVMFVLTDIVKTLYEIQHFYLREMIRIIPDIL